MGRGTYKKGGQDQVYKEMRETYRGSGNNINMLHWRMGNDLVEVVASRKSHIPGK